MADCVPTATFFAAFAHHIVLSPGRYSGVLILILAAHGQLLSLLTPACAISCELYCRPTK